MTCVRQTMKDASHMVVDKSSTGSISRQWHYCLTPFLAGGLKAPLRFS